MKDTSLILEFLKTVINSWPLALVLLVSLFKLDIRNIIQQLTTVSISIGGVDITLNMKDIKITAQKLLAAMEHTLKQDERDCFSKIVKGVREKNKLSVVDIFVNFERDKDNKPMNKETADAIPALRALRGFGLIRPKNGGTWQTDSLIEITEFGDFVVDHEQLKKLLIMN
jgi:hypothetical protein